MEDSHGCTRDLTREHLHCHVGLEPALMCPVWRRGGESESERRFCLASSLCSLCLSIIYIKEDYITHPCLHWLKYRWMLNMLVKTQRILEGASDASRERVNTRSKGNFSYHPAISPHPDSGENTIFGNWFFKKSQIQTGWRQNNTAKEKHSVLQKSTHAPKVFPILEHTCIMQMKEAWRMIFCIIDLAMPVTGNPDSWKSRQGVVGWATELVPHSQLPKAL